ncbi:DUF4397 domain-containing protein [Mucilaginibacter arboris]|uniref:DUF4397 domain-containing protein n=1 Tax=Mucilaginibacter arboris TaxID=2682090 RepID=A0A7K1SUN1_9SPHI|nr:DUF4397 domain-containing protein [Mucilaginibacter arboris]MVN21049.1 DUF4397 domain-containing protein [Mucilaginibacter arboris]
MEANYQFYKLSGLSVIVIIMLLFSSCKDNAATDTSLGNSHLLLVNSAASSFAINLYWTGNKLNPVPLFYGSTTGYKNLTSGVRDVQIKANSNGALLTTNTVHLVRDSSYTFFVYETNNTTTTVITEDDLSIPSFGNAKVRFTNLSAGLSSADLVISNGPVIASSVSFGTIGSYTELKAGTYNFALVVHGSNSVLLNIPNVRMDNGKTYTIWSGGKVNGTGSTALSVQTFIQ